MKKIVATVFVAIFLVGYVLYHKNQQSNTLVAVPDSSSQTLTDLNQQNGSDQTGDSAPTNVSNSSKTTSASTSTTKPKSTTSTSTAPVTSIKKPAQMYADGTYTGQRYDAFYGFVQVQATIKSGKITSVRFLQYPNDRQNSIEINSYATPILAQEAISAQSANVNIVSGATDTSDAFKLSLSSALTQAKNS